MGDALSRHAPDRDRGRADRPGDQEADIQGQGQDERVFLGASGPGDDRGERIEHRREHGQDRHPGKRLAAGPDDDQHAGEADDDRDPAPGPDGLTRQQRGE